jgi:hypothetical protein
LRLSVIRTLRVRAGTPALQTAHRRIIQKAASPVQHEKIAPPFNVQLLSQIRDCIGGGNRRKSMLFMKESLRAEIHGFPGDRARAAGVMRAIGPVLAALFACGVFVGWALPQIAPGAAGAGLLAAAAFLMWAVRDGFRGIDAFFKGARGEERVAALLAALPRGYHVFHDFPCGAADGIDHVAVGPAGLFAVETKCWSGEVTFERGLLLVNGGEPSRPPLQQVRASVQALTRFLGGRLGAAPGCVPVVCFASETFKPGCAVCDGTVVCNASALLAQIGAHAGHLSADEVERIVKVMERKDT